MTPISLMQHPKIVPRGRAPHAMFNKTETSLQTPQKGVQVHPRIERGTSCILMYIPKQDFRDVSCGIHWKRQVEIDLHRTTRPMDRAFEEFTGVEIYRC